MYRTAGFLLLMIVIVPSHLSAQGKPALKISHLAGDFYVYTTSQLYNNTPFSSNSVFLVTDKGVVLIDTPWDTAQCQPLLDSIAARHKKKVVLSISTHYHEDRTGGLQFFASKGVQTYSSKKTLDLCKQFGNEQATFYFERDTTFSIGNYQFQTYYAGAGHTNDNIVVWFPANKILYVGCLIKSTEATDLGNITNADVKAWPATITKLKNRFPDPLYVIPRHQSWQSNCSIDHTLHLLQTHK